ncbi:MAG: type III-A CRISPR-associated RAMP protein Csm4 [Proteobacteria bacterium]|nr:type III-A CRISPR-associated RAMP protein Csm4 [Pseudomonadota bacterium]
MELFIFKIKFKGPVHFDETGIYLENVQETVSSDTFFSALINAVSIHFGKGEADEWIRKFYENPPFLVSSLFIYKGNTFFLPKPLYDSFLSESIRTGLGKEIRKLRWLNAEDFLRWQKQDIFKEEELLRIKEEQVIYENSYKVEIRPRVTLDRVTNQSTIYFCGLIKFKEDAGLYGLVIFNDKSFIERFYRVLTLLGHTGIGGERTYGYGNFEVLNFEKVSGVFEKIASDGNKFTLLSLYHPSKDERENIEKKLISYEIKRKKGWITSGKESMPLKRKSLGFLVEGSVFLERVKGALVDVTPESPPPNMLSHRIYRYGYAFLLPIKES